jgi:ParB-like chromosome segregation protein Spo0J
MSAELKLEMWDPQELIPYDLNAKKHDKAQITRIANAIKRHGWDVPIVVDRDGVIIKGHGRRLAALELGLKKVPVIRRTDLTPEQVKAARLADNRVAIGDFDPEKLRADLADIDLAELEGIFDDKELQFTTADLGEMSTDVFSTDMGSVIEQQQSEVSDRMDAAGKARVSLARAFGFKDVPTTGQKAIATLMSKAEAATGLKNEEALIAWASSL